jgi:hypothetical protein
MSDSVTQEDIQNVWRSDLTGSGYFWHDAGIIDSKQLRQMMFDIKTKIGFGFRSMTRFDQQETTRFHQDGGPDLNMLVLGYEPSLVKSHLYIADHVCAANDLGVASSVLLSEAISGRETYLEHYITELPQPKEGHSYILLIDNSKSLGVLHKAVIPQTADTPRVINSMMLIPGPDEISEEQQQHFLTTDEFYYLNY